MEDGKCNYRVFKKIEKYQNQELQTSLPDISNRKLKDMITGHLENISGIIINQLYEKDIPFDKPSGVLSV